MITTRAQALLNGFTDKELHRLCRNGSLYRLRPGVYVPGAEVRALDNRSRHCLSARAALLDVQDGSTLSHGTAAAMHDLWLWGLDLNRVHISHPATTSRSRGGSQFHRAQLPDAHVSTVDGTPVTSLGRTIADLAASATFESAVVAGDSALRLGLTREECLSVVQQLRPRRGAAAVRRVIAFLDTRSESAGESRSRVLIHRAGLPTPDLQRAIFSRSGVLIGRADFVWDEQRVIGEFDGKEKYLKYLKPGQTSADAVFEEKRREDGFRSLGWDVRRWIWDDVESPAQLIEELGARLL